MEVFGKTLVGNSWSVRGSVEYLIIMRFSVIDRQLGRNPLQSSFVPNPPTAGDKKAIVVHGSEARRAEVTGTDSVKTSRGQVRQDLRCQWFGMARSVASRFKARATGLVAATSELLLSPGVSSRRLPRDWIRDTHLTGSIIFECSVL